MVPTRRSKLPPVTRSPSPVRVKQESPGPNEDFDNILSSKPDEAPVKKKRKKSKNPPATNPPNLPNLIPAITESRTSASAPISPKRSSKILTPPPTNLLAPSISTFLSSLPLPLHDPLYPSFQKLGCITSTDLLVMASQTVLGTNCREQFLVALKRDLATREVELSEWQSIVLNEGFKGVWQKFGHC